MKIDGVHKLKPCSRSLVVSKKMQNYLMNNFVNLLKTTKRHIAIKLIDTSFKFGTMESFRKKSWSTSI